MKHPNAASALNLIGNNEFIWSHSMAATPYSMLDALAQVARDKQNLTLLSLHTEKSGALCAPELAGHLRQRVFFVAHEGARQLTQRFNLQIGGGAEGAYVQNQRIQQTLTQLLHQ